MKELMAELKVRAKAKEDRSAAMLTSPALPIHDKQAERTQADENPRGTEVVGGGSMKDSVTELAAKAKAREKQASVALEPPPLPPTQRQNNTKGTRTEDDAGGGAPAGGGGMKGLMAELIANAKARAQKSGAATSK